MRKTTDQFILRRNFEIIQDGHKKRIDFQAMKMEVNRITDQVIKEKSKGGILTESSREHTDWKTRLAAFIEFGFNDDAKYDENPIIRYNAVKATGDVETAIKTDPCIFIEHFAHEVRGWNEMDKLHENELISESAYRILGWTPDAKQHDSIDIRKQYYFHTNQMELAKEDGEANVRQWAYEELGWEEKAKSDENSTIRNLAYSNLGWEEKAKQDEYWVIREQAYEHLGYDEQAKEDPDEDIREQAYEHLGWTEQAMSDEHEGIREAAYEALGYLQEDLKNQNTNIRDGAIEYFIQANLLLDSPDGIMKTKFTEDETCLLEMNQIPVRKQARLK